ncbi:MAG: SAM-dependent chlorinase/fluorinase [Nanoarchaeota archaeon]
MRNKVFAIITDFGFDFSVASMKALILRSFPDAQIIDIDHSIKRFSILSGAFVIDKIYKYFPEGTIFICVVDPGVGSKREPIYLDTGSYKFIGPNNGLFHHVLNDPEASCKSYVIKEEFKPVKSSTFHGRDLFTPAAIEIAKNNLDIVESIERNKLVFLQILDDGIPVVTYIDGFGNIKTNISFDDDFNKEDLLKVHVNNTLHLIKISNTFSDVKIGELLCYKGSNDTLEIAANLASAGDILKVNIGDHIIIEE